MKKGNIAFIGGGNMARSLIAGLIDADFDHNAIWVSDPSEEKLNDFKTQWDIHTTTHNLDAMQHAEMVVLAIKPQIMPTLLAECASALSMDGRIVLSIAAGINASDLRRALGADCDIIRAMPNLAAMVGSAATGLYADDSVNSKARDQAEMIMRSVGVTVWVDKESHMDIVTALSGSGPAYFFYFMDELTKAATQQGLPEETAKLLSVQTALGAAHAALESKDDLASLIKNVTSPGGTTEAALTILRDAKVDDVLSQTLQAARARAVELANELSTS